MAVDYWNSRRKWPVNNSLAGDPAAGKGAALAGSAAGAADYWSRVRQFNKDLYRPSDTIPKAEYAGPGQSGWQSPGFEGAYDIARKYGGPSAALATAQFRDGMPAPAGSAGPATADSGYIDTSPLQNGAFMAKMPASGPVEPPGNAAQRWKSTPTPAWFQNAVGAASDRARAMGPSPASNGPQGRMAGDGSSADSTDRYYQRKQMRDMQLSSKNPAAQDYYRQRRNTGWSAY